jgi:hypothetical protein
MQIAKSGGMRTLLLNAYLKSRNKMRNNKVLLFIHDNQFTLIVTYNPILFGVQELLKLVLLLRMPNWFAFGQYYVRALRMP